MAIRTVVTPLLSVAVPDATTDWLVSTWSHVGAPTATAGLVVSGSLTSKGTEVRADALPAGSTASTWTL